MVKFDGIYSALYSVYDKEMNVKKDTVHGLMKYQRDRGVKGFYVGGNTGECTILPNKTRMQMLDAVMEEKGDSKVIAHIGAGHFDDTVELVKHADECGVDAIASLPPSLTSYYKNDEVVEYYKKLASLTDKPVFAYITGVFKGDVVDFAEKLMTIENCAGLKLSIPDYFSFGKLRTFNSEMNLLNGPDETLLAGLAMGANGAIGTSYNILPEVAVHLYECFQKGDMAEAFKAQKKLNHVIIFALGGSGLQYWKAYMEVFGFDMGYTAFPAKPVTPEQMADIEENLRQVANLD